MRKCSLSTLHSLNLSSRLRRHSRCSHSSSSSLPRCRRHGYVAVFHNFMALLKTGIA